MSQPPLKKINTGLNGATAPKLFEDVQTVPADAIFGLLQQFKDCKAENKLNLTVGAYRDENLQPFVLPSVKSAQLEILSRMEKGLENNEYSGIAGVPRFRQLARELILGSDFNRPCASLQTVSGTGALRVALDFVRKVRGDKTLVYLSSPTWGNHKQIANEAGLETRNYRYYDAKTITLDFDGLISDLKEAPPGSVVVLHTCAHNPTGIDPSAEQWRAILDLLEERHLIPLFDTAYQGYASGDMERDAFSVREAARRNMDFIICQSFSKNMGLYGQRCGAIHVVTGSEESATAVHSQMEKIIRPQYSNPPRHGAEVAAMIMGDPVRRQQWLDEVKQMSARIARMRTLLRDALQAAGVPGDWSHITNQIGMFSYTGLSRDAVLELRRKHNVYMLENGRISMAGLSERNMQQFVDAVKDVLSSRKSAL